MTEERKTFIKNLVISVLVGFTILFGYNCMKLSDETDRLNSLVYDLQSESQDLTYKLNNAKSEVDELTAQVEKLQSENQRQAEQIIAMAEANESAPVAVKPVVETVYITPSGTKYHSEGCGYLHDNAIPVPITDAENRGYAPCSRCR